MFNLLRKKETSATKKCNVDEFSSPEFIEEMIFMTIENYDGKISKTCLLDELSWCGKQVLSILYGRLIKQNIVKSETLQLPNGRWEKFYSIMGDNKYDRT